MSDGGAGGPLTRAPAFVAVPIERSLVLGSALGRRQSVAASICVQHVNPRYSGQVVNTIPPPGQRRKPHREGAAETETELQA
jgi:hypothetical protein